MRDLLLARRPWLGIAFVAAIALVMRSIYLYQFSSLPDWNQLTVDNWYHHNWAMTIADGNVFGDTTYFRAPLYAWCLGALYFLFSPSILVARLFGIAVGVASVILTYRIADNIAGRRAALIAAVIQAIYPMLMMTEAELLLDPLFMLLVQALILCVQQWAVKRNFWAMLVSSLIAGLAVITRPTLLVLVPVLFGMLLWQIRHHRTTLVRQVLAVVLGLSVTVGAVFTRNLIIANDPVLVASQGGINFFIGNNDAADGLHAVMPEPFGYNWRIADITYLAEQSRGHSLKPGEVSSYWTRETWHWIFDHLFRFAQLTLKRLWFSFADLEIDNNRLQATLKDRIPIAKYNPLGFGILFILAVAGAAMFWRPSDSTRWLVVGALALTLVNALFFVNSRFRLPLLPVYCVLAGVGVAFVAENFRSVVRRTLPAVAAVAAGIVAYAPSLAVPRQTSAQDELSRGLVFYNSGNYHTALASYRLAFATDSAFPDVNANLGAAHLRLGLADSARVYFEREIVFHPARSLAYANTAALALVKGQIDSAGRFAVAAINRKPYEPAPWIVLIRASAQTPGISRDSLRTVGVRASNTTRNNPDVCFEAAAALDAVGDDDAAIELFGRVADSRPLPIETDDRMFTSGYRTAIAKEERQRARANMSLGAIYGRRGEYAQAATYSASAIAVDSNLSGAWVNLISAKVQLGLDTQAKELMQSAIVRFPNDPFISSLKTRLIQ
jgi:4-amino-4-deoxy-L-arabinose transferase-like glycosyltransferase